VHDLDLLDRASMASTVTRVLESEARLDTLINNAGYGLIGGVEQVDLNQARANFETNFFGTLALIQEVLPAMRRQRSGRPHRERIDDLRGRPVPSGNWLLHRDEGGA
jgi:NADP-dependent 3-hydroxy acid dehydrogenase YdfG